MDADDWNERYRVEGLLWREDPNRFVVEELEHVAPGRALDLGCGEGRNAVWLAARGWRVTGVDFSRVALEKAQLLAGDRGVEVEWVEADVRTWRPDEAAYDLVIVCYLHLQAEERRQAFAHAAAGLAPGGTFLVVGHDLANLAYGIGGPQDPAILYTAGDIAGELAPLDVERACIVERPVETPETRRIAFDTLVRGRRLA